MSTVSNEPSTPRASASDVAPAPLTPSASTPRGSDPSKQPSIVQVEAAKLRLVTDRRLGKQSPAWLQRVAQGLPPQGATAAG